MPNISKDIRDQIRTVHKFLYNTILMLEKGHSTDSKREQMIVDVFQKLIETYPGKSQEHEIAEKILDTFYELLYDPKESFRQYWTVINNYIDILLGEETEIKTEEKENSESNDDNFLDITTKDKDLRNFDIIDESPSERFKIERPDIDRNKILSRNFKKKAEEMEVSHEVFNTDDFKRELAIYIKGIKLITRSYINEERESFSDLIERLSAIENELWSFMNHIGDYEAKNDGLQALSTLASFKTLSPKEIETLDVSVATIDDLSNFILDIIDKLPQDKQHDEGFNDVIDMSFKEDAETSPTILTMKDKDKITDSLSQNKIRGPRDTTGIFNFDLQRASSILRNLKKG